VSVVAHARVGVIRMVLIIIIIVIIIIIM
jgi:hypothetical protein